MYKTFLAFLITVFFAACTNAQNTETESTSLAPKAFSEKIKETPNAQVLDVRTPGEYEKGHLENAFNVNWNGDNFLQKAEALDKNKPVFVYCLSGGRSAAAANELRRNGFEKVYEMDGGMMQWRAANLPETSNKPASAGMTMEQYEALLNTDQFVLVDFNAPWCPPCKKMTVNLEAIKKDMGDKVSVVSINVDDNSELCKTLKVTAPPYLKIYKDKKMIWEHEGYIDDMEIRKQLK